MLLVFPLLVALLQPMAGEAATPPEGTRSLFRDDLSTPAAWQGGRVIEEGGSSCWRPETPGDTVLLEREVDFTLAGEGRLAFSFMATGYQRLRVLAWVAGDTIPRAVVLTHYPQGQRQQVELPLEGNFHNFHWREGNYSALREGDRLTRLAFEFTLNFGSGRAVRLGELLVYQLTEDYHREHLRKALAEAHREVGAGRSGPGRDQKPAA